MNIIDNLSYLERELDEIILRLADLRGVVFLNKKDESQLNDLIKSGENNIRRIKNFKENFRYTSDLCLQRIQSIDSYELTTSSCQIILTANNYLLSRRF